MQFYANVKAHLFLFSFTIPLLVPCSVWFNEVPLYGHGQHLKIIFIMVLNCKTIDQTGWFTSRCGTLGNPTEMLADLLRVSAIISLCRLSRMAYSRVFMPGRISEADLEQLIFWEIFCSLVELYDISWVDLVFFLRYACC